MNRIALVACGKEKADGKRKASELYTGTFFKKSLAYAQQLEPNSIYILSAKYGVLEMEQEVDPYDLYLPKLTAAQRQAWGLMVVDQLSSKTDFKHDRFYVLAGAPYRKFLETQIADFIVPMKGVGGIGKQMRWLTERIDV